MYSLVFTPCYALGQFPFVEGLFPVSVPQMNLRVNLFISLTCEPPISMESTFTSCSLSDLQNFLKVRNVPFTGLRKPEVIDLCQAAQEIGIAIDPDGLLEDREEVISNKLQKEDGFLKMVYVSFLQVFFFPQCM